MATETSLPSNETQDYSHSILRNTTTPVAEFTPPTVPTTIYKFPTMEPLRFESYSSKYLYLPLRRDILHRAVIFEGDATRQGTASTKTRYEVHGSHRKVRPQKGMGKARLGTRQSPVIRGGGKSFGPHPRDFSTELPRKVYDLAWRTALSWRYRKGGLIICEDGMDIDYLKARYAKRIFDHNHWGNAYGRSLVVTNSYRKNLFGAMQDLGSEGRVQVVDDVDVKDLLEQGRIIIEKSALDEILRQHQSDLVAKVRTGV
ncbi:50S ribosomal protein-like protein L4 [Venustampulla echinocandica]|uniref:Large ribosomal subunit protein uL4m n=1 Tax=Venustampulla echinocandica TaxID=2656787 RepID=A0A370TV75_9HELO|nr:50S ribosomal protein-like protein L4 [Venustampulla echinocandica]RDL39442.1 50S ribosomal protein-like protein L4 [Venustampulla echinocandica]